MQWYSSKVDHCDPNPNPCRLRDVCFFGIFVFVCRQFFLLELISSDNRQLEAILDGPSISKSQREREYYDCSKIDTLPIVREIGRGKQKTVFEVILPTGEHVAAKRCSHRLCERKKMIMYEELFYRKLYEAFDTKALGYYGFCSFSVGDTKPYNPKILTRGSTLLIELGTPMLEAWGGWNEAALRPTSKADLEDLRDIARQYDTFPDGPLLMSGDNIYPHQYMRNKAGKLRHIDFDMVEQMPPPVNSTLEGNCEVMLGGFAKLTKEDPRFNCSIGYKQEIDGKHVHSIDNSTRPPFSISPLPTNMAFKTNDRRNINNDRRNKNKNNNRRNKNKYDDRRNKNKNDDRRNKNKNNNRRKKNKKNDRRNKNKKE